MKAKRPAPATASEERRPTKRQPAGGTQRRSAREAPPRRRKAVKEQRPLRSAPQTTPISRPLDKPARAKNTSQAKARAKARKAKAPKVVRPSLRERIILRLSSIELNPRTLAAKVPFVVLVIASLGLGLAITLWLSTDSAERSYQLRAARQTNQALLQQKEALERDVLEAQAAPALAESARQLGMIPSRDTAHLVQDPAGNWLVVGTPKPAEGVPPPPLNVPLPDETPAPPPPPAPRMANPRELTLRPPVTEPPAALPLPQVVPPAPAAPAPPAPVGQNPGGDLTLGIPGQPPALGQVQPPALGQVQPPVPGAPILPGPPPAGGLTPLTATLPGAPA